MPEPLTAAAFAPFGEVLEESTAKQVKIINEKTTRRLDDLATTDFGDGRPCVSLFAATPRPQPIRIAMMEYHPLGSQAFMPAANLEWLVVVAPSNAETPTISELRCFLAQGWQGVNYHRGVWHHPLLILHENHNFWVLDRAAPPGEDTGANLREYWFKQTDICQVVVE
ncbi:MAG: ureidoglycolate lyase [Gammaproteobacteria bacterium WSBS_2016_MAG_OTU1]